MRMITKLGAAALMLGGSAVLATTPASAGVSVGIGIGGPGPAWYGDYNYDAPCSWYEDNDLPAPYRCYGYFSGIWGPGIYVDGDFIFRDRAHWGWWRDRPEYSHWRAHDWHWHAYGHGWHGHHGWVGGPHPGWGGHPHHHI